MRTKIAIGCHGGGSQTAFTAGVLKTLSVARLQDEFEVVLPRIDISDKVRQSMDYEGKLNRSPKNVGTLIVHGEERGRTLLTERERRLGASARIEIRGGSYVRRD